MDTQGLTKEEMKQQLNRFDEPLDLEWQVMEQLYKNKKMGKDFVHATEMFQTLGIRDGTDLRTIHESRFISIKIVETHECFFLTKDGMNYMDSFSTLMLRFYQESAGKVENSEMVNTEKRARAQQATKKFLREKITNSPRDNHTGAVDGVELYARNLINNGIITSDSRTKVVTENYVGDGEVSSFSKKQKLKWWESTPVQIVFVLAALAAIIGLF